MIIIRRTFFCKVGQAGRVVEILREFVRITKESGIPLKNQLVMTDLVGRTDRVVWAAMTDSMMDPRDIGQRFFQHHDAARLFEELSGLIDGAEVELFALEFREE
jgi:hypothetical protein